MKKMGITSHLITLYILLGMCAAYAHQDNPWKIQPEENTTKDANLVITPSICVIKEVGEICQQKLTILFTSKQRRDICIYNSRDVEPLWCDGKVKEVTLEVSVKVNSSINLLARDSDTNTILASSTFSLNLFQPVKKRPKRHYGIGIL
ncbi:hypothetical protein TQ33_1661 [Kangiella geojedonensis]|uniref:DUF3019 domain-containing protein n=2 Tax=Kangiella geojedonensis TaxID=914150 RepID=A0A0F6RCP7_9GAMM|nr:hypothetical protein TQ33_1661 [Kangiella geojedonensis]